MTAIHPTAIVAPGAELADDVAIGPYCTVGADVVLGAGVRLMSHVSVDGWTRIGARTVIYPFASVGHAPQDLKYKGERTELVIGEDNQLREHVAVNRGTVGGGGVTRIGDRCLFMNGSHIGHDCRVGDGVIIASNGTLGGHVELGDAVIIGGLAAIHQFTRIGRNAMIGGMAGVERDVIPFGMVTGNRATLKGLNLIGLKRRGFPREEIHALRGAFRRLAGGDGTLAARLDSVEAAYPASALVKEMATALRHPSSRGALPPQLGNDGDDGDG
jgi:UDP-N-acetylglucosamine acyltransferase